LRCENLDVSADSIGAKFEQPFASYGELFKSEVRYPLRLRKTVTSALIESTEDQDQVSGHGIAPACPTCGSPIETTSAGDLGCIACLLNSGLETEAEQSDLASALAPDQLGAYIIEHHTDGSVWELGHGAMGVTYRAIDKALDRPVALKIINTDGRSRSAEARERFMREARAAAALRHPNVATVYQFGVREETGQFFYAMELVEGETLEERVRRLGPLDVLTTIDIALQVTAALEAAEERGLVHRDLKPGNLMLVSRNEGTALASTEQGGYSRGRGVVATALRRRARHTDRATDQWNQKFVVKVIDFGVAKAVAEKTNAMAITHGGFVGTPAFASPEQFTNASVDVRSDIYSLGATLWFLLTGHILYSGHTTEEIQEARGSKPLPILQLKAARVPSRFISLIVSMLAIEPAARPAGARELSARLQAIRASILGRGKLAARLAISAAIVTLAAIVGLRVSNSLRVKTIPPAIPDKSIAVLPFVDLSQAHDQEYFCEGVSEEILDALSKVEGLRVVARTSSFSFKGKNVDVAEIGQKLNVQNVLEGSLRREGNRVRITAQLINARDGFHVWSDTFEREWQGVFAVQDEITRAIVDALKVKLAVARTSRVPQNTKAYDLYLQGLYFLNKSDEESLRKSLTLFQRALDIDPNFARAWTGIAKAWLWLADAYVRPLEAYPKMLEAASKAVALDERDAEAHCYLGKTKRILDRNLFGEEGELKRALEIDPNLAPAHFSMSLLKSAQGELEEGIKEIQEAERLDPLAPMICSFAVGVYLAADRIDDAIDAGKRMLQLDPNYVYLDAALADAYREKGDFKEAVALYEKAQATRQFPSAGLAITYARMGRREDARRILDQLIEKSRRQYVAADWIATVYIALGEKDEAFRWLDRACNEHSAPASAFLFHPEYRAVRSDPRFADLLRRTGIDPAKVQLLK
jgi:TolB-like protein/Tfp pilus assembly protein PilF